MDRRVQLSVKVAEEIAEHRGVEPTDMEPPLYDVLDPDSLDTLFCDSGEGGESSVTVRFTYDDSTVVVESPNRVTVNDSEPGIGSRSQSQEHASTD